MKVKTLSALASLGGALILSGSADAAYTGLSVHLVNAGVIAGGAARDVYHVYANFTNSNDRVDLWGGTPLLGQASIYTRTLANATPGSGGNFFNPLPGSSNLAPYAPGGSDDFGTFGTIGLRYGNEGPTGTGSTPTDATAISAGSTLPFITGGTWSSAPNGSSWFVTQADVQGQAGYRVSGEDTDTRVLLMQLAVNAGSHVEGSGILVQGWTFVPGAAGGALVLFQAQNQSFSSVPAPGALALLGLAGLVGSRRRRA